MQSVVKKIELPMSQDYETGWKPYHQFRISTKSVNRISNHVSVLSPGITPHPPHSHPDEEILIMLSGKADVILGDNHERHRLRKGQFAYYPSYYQHTINNCTSEPATYMMFKWVNNRKTRNKNTLERSIYSIDFSSEGNSKDKKLKKIFEGPTGLLEKLQCHTTVLKPGDGYEPHADNYDVAIITLEGEVQTLGRLVEPLSVIYYPAGEPHGMKNTGNADAKYIVFEFHGKATRPAFFKIIRRIIRKTLRKLFQFLKEFSR